ncbi:late competence protein ComER [Pseudalkalibacillus berkeleyi]|uniref:Pyrroline-5-carboxylate reductase n=1 Tax=Pseudalkalibacillus berkeleyi TaxID=1069813 RepID=A0ABS9H2H3_9BACL|nr:late competence protein ComER [Pseudalkalibacillus berkeleyi]MCF6137993.1 late competence protein ComER [Pseudalkalibacillus berkeleyi]
MKVGIIGTGNMGTILISAFIDSLAVRPSELMIINRTAKKAEGLQRKYPDLKVGKSNSEVAAFSDILFICVKPLEYYALIESISPYLNSEKLIVSITSPISVEQLEELTTCSVARAIPSITNRALSGASLLTYGKRCSPEQKRNLNRLMGSISTPVQIDQSITRVASDLSSCGPAFFSYLLQAYIDSAVEETNISKEQATYLVSEMVIGMGKLLEKEVYTLPTLLQKVCVKGGVTGEALKVFDAELGPLFNHVIKRTHAKYDEDCELVDQQFTKQY